jgi:hypothetical protein
MMIAVTARILAPLACLLITCGCMHFRTHDQAPPTRAVVDLAAHVAAREPKSSPGKALRTTRTPHVVVTYREPEVNPVTDWERIGVALVPLFPYARGEWPLTEALDLGPVVENLLGPSFADPPAVEADLLLEINLTPETYRRFTLTTYGLSIFGGIADIPGYPTSYMTAALDADVRLRDLRAPSYTAPLLERSIHAEETALSGAILYVFVYNTFTETKLLGGAPVLTWDDLIAEALVDFMGDLRGALRDGFPNACKACGLSFTADTYSCERCGAAFEAPAPRGER